MARRTYTDEQKAEALALYATEGPSAVEAKMGIAKGTVASWAHRTGTQTCATETTALATEARLASLAERKARLASDLMGDIQKLRTQLFAACTVRKVVTLSGGKDRSATWEIADVDLDQPSFADQRAIMTTIAIAVDKVQILTGEATGRIDLRHTTPIDDELDRLAADLAAMA